jgi:hypothetical protein
MFKGIDQNRREYWAEAGAPSTPDRSRHGAECTRTTFALCRTPLLCRQSMNSLPAKKKGRSKAARSLGRKRPRRASRTATPITVLHSNKILRAPKSGKHRQAATLPYFLPVTLPPHLNGGEAASRSGTGSCEFSGRDGPAPNARPRPRGASVLTAPSPTGCDGFHELAEGSID